MPLMGCLCRFSEAFSVPPSQTRSRNCSPQTLSRMVMPPFKGRSAGTGQASGYHAAICRFSAPHPSAEPPPRHLCLLHTPFPHSQVPPDAPPCGTVPSSPGSPVSAYHRQEMRGTPPGITHLQGQSPVQTRASPRTDLCNLLPSLTVLST